MSDYSAFDIVSKAQSRFGVAVRRSGKAWNGPCPYCGGKDRWAVWQEGNYFCRVCGEKGWLFDDDPKWRPSEQGAQRVSQIEQAEEERLSITLTEWQSSLKAEYWRGWHDAMTEAQRQYWHSAGIGDQDIEQYGLGWVARKRFASWDQRGHFFETSAYTIPIKDPTHTTVVNTQYRLDPIPDGELGKYRQEFGLAAAAFYARSTAEGHQQAVVVEGSKKAIVIHAFLDREFQVIGMPSATPHERLMTPLEQYRVVWLVMDPGKGFALANRRYERLLGDRLRIVELPGKPDDLVLAGMTRSHFRGFTRLARRGHKNTGKIDLSGALT